MWQTINIVNPGAYCIKVRPHPESSDADQDLHQLSISLSRNYPLKNLICCRCHVSDRFQVIYECILD
jgi:hypothetical protein